MIVINPKKPQSVSGTVIGKKAGLYRVRTASGKVITATATSVWPIGAGVAVLSGSIIGTSGRPRATKIYQV